MIGYSTFRDHLAKDLRGLVPDPSIYGFSLSRSGRASKAAERGVGESFFRDMVDGRVPLPRTDMLKITFPGFPFPSVWVSIHL